MLNLSVIPLDGVINARDLGGIPTRDGHVIRQGMFLRTGGTYELTSKGLELLCSMGLRLSVDLRSLDEIAANPSQLQNVPGIRYEIVPLFDQFVAAGITNSFSFTLPELYRHMLTLCGTEFVRMFRLFAQEKGLCQFNCTAGKDRTGVTTMLLLNLVNVADDIIIEDYVFSESQVSSVVSLQKAQLGDREVDVPDTLLHAYPETMRQTLDFLREKWGSAYEYLTAFGMTEDEISALRRKLIADKA